MKPGYQTTEFWLALTAASIAGGLGYLQTIDAPWAITSASIISIIYTLLRSTLKSKNPK